MNDPYYQDELVTIYNLDCLAGIALLASDTVSTIFTDPPYSSGARNSAATRARGVSGMSRAEAHTSWFGTDNLTANGFAMLVRLVAAECHRVTVLDGHYFSFIDWRQWPILAGAVESAGWTLRSCLVWDKINFGMGNGFRQQAEFIFHGSKGVGDNFIRHDLGTVFNEKRILDKAHPTKKPLGAVELMLSAVPDGVVLDPFMGSGTMIIAAKRLGRRSIGIEVNRQFCDEAIGRINDET